MDTRVACTALIDKLETFPELWVLEESCSSGETDRGAANGHQIIN